MSIVQFEDGSVSVEAGLMLMLDRMRMGKLKVFKEHNDWSRMGASGQFRTIRFQ